MMSLSSWSSRMPDYCPCVLPCSIVMVVDGERESGWESSKLDIERPKLLDQIVCLKLQASHWVDIPRSMTRVVGY